MAGMTLYIGNKNYSSWSLRPWLALKHAGTPFEEVVIPLRGDGVKASILRHSPSGLVPCLVQDGIVIWESLAICEHLADTFPAAALWPKDRAARAHARAISSEMHAGFTRLRQAMPMDIRNRHPLDQRLAYCQGDVDRITAVWREARERFGTRGANGSGAFLYGGFTIADAMYAPVTTRFTTYGVPLDSVCTAYVEAVRNLPAMQEWTAAAKEEPWVIHYDPPVAA
jgi:glutathione S-transferase